MISNVWHCDEGNEGLFKILKNHFWMIQSTWKQVFVRFLDFGQLDWLDIADCDSLGQLLFSSGSTDVLHAEKIEKATQ